MADERVAAVVQGIPVGGGNGLQGVEEAGGGHGGRIGQVGCERCWWDKVGSFRCLYEESLKFPYVRARCRFVSGCGRTVVARNRSGARKHPYGEINNEWI